MNKFNLHTITETNKRLDPIEEANKRYAEKIREAKTIPAYDSRRFELFSEMDSQYDLALNACGLDFIKKICSMNQELAHNILSIFSQAVEKDNFDDVELNFRKLVAKKLEEEEKNKYRRR